MDKRKGTFEESVEYDLYQSDFGIGLFERYHIVETLHQSAQSCVYKVSRLGDGELFTLKALLNEDSIHFDIDHIAYLSHEGMARIVEYWESSQYTYVIKSYVEGVTLFEHVNRRGPLSEKRVKDIAIQISKVLEYLHLRDNPFVYRDLKPANIILTDSGKVVLIDVETMRMVSAAHGTDTFYVGTHGYASPEQYGFTQSDTRSDLYGLGATLYFLLTGTEPVLKKVGYKNIHEINATVSRKVIQVVEKCMKFNPDERYGNILEFQKALTSRFTYRFRKMSRFALTMSTIALLVIAGNLIAYGYSLIESEKHDSVVSKGYESLEAINLGQICNIKNGVHVKAHESKDQHQIIATRELLPECAQDFQFMSVFIIDETFEDQTIQEIIYGVSKLGYGLNYYFDEFGHKVKLEDSRYLVLFFDENIRCVGYHIIEKDAIL
ncbi:MAG: serine/threonine protein kinase [Clostridia bacterium]|nr:serine/threonine protein kinase [Clostridia bacterium]